MNSEIKGKLSNLAKIRTECVQDVKTERIEKLWYESGKADHPDFKFFQIKDNKLYCCFREVFPDYETRFEAGKFNLLSVLSKYKIPDVEFILHDGDVLNTDEPVFVGSCLANRSQLLAPDFSFGFFPESRLYDHSSEIEDLLRISEETGKDFKTWMSRKPEILYRGSLNNSYRGSYAGLDEKEMFDFKHVQTFHAARGSANFTPGTTLHACSRKDKANYRHLLHLNGGEDTAYSSAFRYGLACKSLVFYATNNPCQEWWHHDSIFKKSEHYAEVSSPQELLESYDYYLNNSEEAYRLASNAHKFSSEFLTRESYLYFYSQILQEFARKQKAEIALRPEAQLITSYKKRVDEEITQFSLNEFQH